MVQELSTDDVICKFACQDVLISLGSALDRGANSEAADLFAPDGNLIGPDMELKGNAAVREFLLQRSPQILTRHTLTNIKVTRTTPNTSRATAYVTVYRVPKDSAPLRIPDRPAAAGDWIIDLIKTSNGWQITRYQAVPVLTAE